MIVFTNRKLRLGVKVPDIHSCDQDMDSGLLIGHPSFLGKEDKGECGRQKGIQKEKVQKTKNLVMPPKNPFMF